MAEKLNRKLHMVVTCVDFDGWIKPVKDGSFQGEDLQDLRQQAADFKRDLLQEYPSLKPEQVIIQESYFAMKHNRPELRGVIEKD
jgi:hypothetical protein